jgi:hypothetical protein
MWGAILAGAAAAISIQFVFTVLGIALGLSVVDPTGNAMVSTASNDAGASGEGIAMGVGIWWLVTGTVSLLLGGAVLGRVAGMVRGVDVLLHAFTMWAVTAIFGFTVLWSSAGMASATGWNSSANSTASQRTYMSNRSDIGTRTDASTRTDTGAVRDSSSPNFDRASLDRAHRNARAASWWSVLGLLAGVAASLGGAWITTPDRIIVRPAAHPAPAM